MYLIYAVSLYPECFYISMKQTCRPAFISFCPFMSSFPGLQSWYKIPVHYRYYNSRQFLVYDKVLHPTRSFKQPCSLTGTTHIMAVRELRRERKSAEDTGFFKINTGISQFPWITHDTLASCDPGQPCQPLSIITAPTVRYICWFTLLHEPSLCWKKH